MDKLTIVLCLALLSGCSAVVDSVDTFTEEVQEKQDKLHRQVTESTNNSSPIPGDPYYAPIEPRKNPMPLEITGSLFNPQISSDLYSYAPTFALGDTINVGMGQDQDFEGESGSSQSHKMHGRITVSVIDVLNNGNLVVRGEKWLVINNGKEYIRLTGIIRPLDITEQNSVESFQVADSRIEFSATGEHADVQTRGWLSSLFSGSLWPI